MKQADPVHPNGWASLELPIEGAEHAALILLGIGPEIEVLEPPAVRERLRALAREVARRAA